MPGKAYKKPLLVRKKLLRSVEKLPRSLFWSAAKLPEKAAKKAAKKPLLVGEKLPRSQEKLLRRLPRSPPSFVREKLPRSIY